MLNKLKAERISAMKERNTTKKNVLGVLIGEIELKNKDGNGDLSEQDIFKLIKKMIDNNILTNDTEENQYIESYLPSMMSDSDLEILIIKIISENNLEGMRGMGIIMKKLNETNAGQFDGKTASIISKKLL